MKSLDALVVGAGFAGSVCARRMAEDYGHRVLVIDRRPHVAGNAHDAPDEHGVLIHTYGPHIFHTNAPSVSRFLSRFTEWRPYEHRVWAEVDGRIVPLPINRTTVEALHRIQFPDEDATAAYLASLAEPRDELTTSEDVVVAKVGRDLYERLFRGYTLKHWGLDPGELDASVCRRLPVRFDHDDRYFGDAFQMMPADGFTSMFERMLDHPEHRASPRHRVRGHPQRGRDPTCRVDRPDRRVLRLPAGHPPYRSLQFERETRATPGGRLVQPVAVINYPNERILFTRVTEFRHLTGQVSEFSTLTYDYPTAEGDPYYPVPRPENRDMYRRYEALAADRPDVLFVGRLARYQYLNMDQVVAQALVAVDRWAAERGLDRALPEAA